MLKGAEVTSGQLVEDDQANAEIEDQRSVLDEHAAELEKKSNEEQRRKKRKWLVGGILLVLASCTLFAFLYPTIGPELLISDEQLGFTPFNGSTIYPLIAPSSARDWREEWHALENDYTLRAVWRARHLKNSECWLPRPCPKKLREASLDELRALVQQRHHQAIQLLTNVIEQNDSEKRIATEWLAATLVRMANDLYRPEEKFPLMLRAYQLRRGLLGSAACLEELGWLAAYYKENDFSKYKSIREFIVECEDSTWSRQSAEELLASFDIPGRKFTKKGYRNKWPIPANSAEARQLNSIKIILERKEEDLEIESKQADAWGEYLGGNFNRSDKLFRSLLKLVAFKEGSNSTRLRWIADSYCTALEVQGRHKEAQAIRNRLGIPANQDPLK